MLEKLNVQVQSINSESKRYNEGTKAAGLRIRKHLAEVKKLLAEIKKATLKGEVI